MLKPGLWDWQGYLGFGVWANPGWKPYSLLGCQVGTSKKPDTLTYFQALCGSQKLRVWICIHIYLYICVWFELKFSTGQVAPKLDSPVQNRTPGNPTLYQKLLKHNLLTVNMPLPMAKKSVSKYKSTETAQSLQKSECICHLQWTQLVQRLLTKLTLTSTKQLGNRTCFGRKQQSARNFKQSFTNSNWWWCEHAILCTRAPSADENLQQKICSSATNQEARH